MNFRCSLITITNNNNNNNNNNNKFSCWRLILGRAGWPKQALKGGDGGGSGRGGGGGGGGSGGGGDGGGVALRFCERGGNTE